MKKQDPYLICGLVTGIVVAIVSLFIHVGPAHPLYADDIAADVPFLIGVMINGALFSRAHKHYVSFLDVLKSCLRASLVVAILVVATYFLNQFMHAAAIDQAWAEARRKVVQENPDRIQSINKTMQYIRYGTPIFIGVLTFIMGAIFSLLAAALVKKKGAMPPPQMS